VIILRAHRETMHSNIDGFPRRDTCVTSTLLNRPTWNGGWPGAVILLCLPLSSQDYWHAPPHPPPNLYSFMWNIFLLSIMFLRFIHFVACIGGTILLLLNCIQYVNDQSAYHSFIDGQKLSHPEPLCVSFYRYIFLFLMGNI
jgi:hypothetical protein